MTEAMAVEEPQVLPITEQQEQLAAAAVALQGTLVLAAAVMVVTAVTAVAEAVDLGTASEEAMEDLEAEEGVQLPQVDLTGAMEGLEAEEEAQMAMEGLEVAQQEEEAVGDLAQARKMEVLPITASVPGTEMEQLLEGPFL